MHKNLRLRVYYFIKAKSFKLPLIIKSTAQLMGSILIKEPLQITRINNGWIFIEKTIPLILSLCIISCTNDLHSCNQGSYLTMKLSSQSIIGDQKTIEAIFSLGEDTQSVILDTYQLKITLTGQNNKLLYTNVAGEQERVSSVYKKLTSFTQKRELSIEDEPLVLPFTLVPALGIDDLKIIWELLDENGRSIQLCQANWTNSINQVTLPVILSSSEGIKEPSDLTKEEQERSSVPNMLLQSAKEDKGNEEKAYRNIESIALFKTYNHLPTSTNSLQWKEFFKDLGAIGCWNKLQTRESKLNFNLEKLETTIISTDAQANSVLAGILHYLIYQQLPVKSLSGKGGLDIKKRITFLPACISQLTSLQALNLSYNMLNDLPASISQLTNLKTLQLSANDFETLPNVIGNLTSLQKLILSGNQIPTLPSCIGQLTNLKELDLWSVCAMPTSPPFTLPTFITNLISLQKLNVGRNKLTALPCFIGDLINLEYLDVDNNALQSLPQSITQLTNLKSINLSNNQLKALPNSMARLCNINSLSIDLSENPLFKPNDLYLLTEEVLKSYAYAELPRSLRTLCANVILEYIGQPKAYMDMDIDVEENYENIFQKAFHILRSMYTSYSPPYQLKPIFNEKYLQKVLPKELWAENLSSLIQQECELNNPQKIIFFKKINTNIEEVPIYLTYHLCTSKDVKAMLQKVKEIGLKLYLSVS